MYFKRRLVIQLLLMCWGVLLPGIYAVGQNPFRLPKEQIIKEQPLDLFYYSSLYKELNSEQEIKQLYLFFQKGLKDSTARVINHLAYALSVNLKGNHPLSLEILNRVSKKLSQEYTLLRVEYYSVMASVAVNSENPKQALQYSRKCLQELDKSIALDIVQGKWMQHGVILNAAQEPEQAMASFNKALNMEPPAGNRNSLYLRLNIALTNGFLGKPEEAKKNFKEALLLIRKYKDYLAEQRTLGNIADLLFWQDSLAESEKYYLAGKKVAQEHSFNLDLIRYGSSLSMLYAKQNRFKEAYLSLKTSDSLSHTYNPNQISDKMVEIEMDRKVEQERRLKEVNARLLQSERRQKWIIGSFSLLLIGVLWLLAKQLKISNEQNQFLLQQSLQQLKAEPVLVVKEAGKMAEANVDLIVSLEELVMGRKLFADPDLNLEGLAKQLQSNRTYLSEAINTHYGVNFSRWLNEIRIKEAQLMLINPEFDKYSIEGIALQAGFSSISVFNGNFKKITGLTPTYFRKNRNL